METKGAKIAPESYLLAALCLLDLATTVFWISYRDASEGNPLMSFYLQHGGTSVFIAAKLVLCILPLFIAEWARRTRPRFVQAALRFGIAAYFTLYGLGVMQVNSAEAINAAEAAANEQTMSVASFGNYPTPANLARR